MIYQGDTLSVRYLENGIAELNFDATGPVNKFDTKTLNSLNEALDALLKEIEIKALLITTKKPAFVVGADINEFLTLFGKPEKELSDWLGYANTIFNTLEDLPFPTVSVISGYALGGGCECILATDFRIADTTAKIGLPETKLGIIPGFGGCVRMPRLLGADTAMDLISSGKKITASAALKCGLIDAITSPEHLHKSGIALANRAINGKLNWQARRQQKKAPLQLNKIEASMCFTTAKSRVRSIAGPHYPAPLAAVIAIEEGAFHARERALEIETQYFITLAKNQATQALVGIYLNDQFLKSNTKQACKKGKDTEQALVLGAGIMGGGIAYQSAVNGVPVIMKDISQASIDAGMKEAGKHLNKQHKRGKFTAIKMAEIFASIQPRLDYVGIENVDIVIEAVVENPKIKATVLSEVEKRVSKKTVLTSNTSTIPINVLAQSLQRPENFCGMHFFNPVHRMPLVEVIRGQHTSDETISRVVAFAAKMGKSPVVVNDCPGFFVNRVLFPYFAAFNLLLRDTADFKKIDLLMENVFGWPMGPAWLLDVVGIDTAHHAQAVMAKGFPDTMAKNYRDAIDILFESGRLGQKNGLGFYKYTLDRKRKQKKEIDPDAVKLLSFSSNPASFFDENDIINRMMVPMINEVVRCLEERIIASPQEADIALVYGLGFPAFRGGVFRYLDTMGLKNYIDIADKLASLGPLYVIPKSLRDKASKNETYLNLP